MNKKNPNEKNTFIAIVKLKKFSKIIKNPYVLKSVCTININAINKKQHPDTKLNVYYNGFTANIFSYYLYTIKISSKFVSSTF